MRFFCKNPKKTHFGLKLARKPHFSMTKCSNFMPHEIKKRGISLKYHAR